MSRLEAARQTVALALLRLSKHFVPEAKLTFVMRVPGNPDATFIVTEDDEAEVEAAIRGLREQRAPAPVSPAARKGHTPHAFEPDEHLDCFVCGEERQDAIHVGEDDDTAQAEARP